MNYIDIEISDSVNFTQEKAEEVKNIINKVCEEEKLPFPVYVSVIITTKEEIQAINKEQRGIDSPTDVLSFPYLEFDENYNLRYELSEEDYDPEYNAVCLGDMVICYDKIVEQAKEYGHSEERELSYLTVHSMYHR